MLEFVVAGAIVAILGACLMYRLDFYQAEARALQMRATVTDLRTALRLKSMERYLRGTADDLQALTEQNPVDWLERKPANYKGAFYAPHLEQIGGDAWFFDRKQKCLTYVLRDGIIFSERSLKAISFKVELSRLPITTVRPPGTPPMQGVTLNQIEE